MKQKIFSNTRLRSIFTVFPVVVVFASCERSGSDVVSGLRKVTDAAHEKAIDNNIRQLAAVADQYYLETGKTSASFTDIVGPDKYSTRIVSVDGETYPTSFKKGEPIVVKLRDGATQRQKP
jgi:hypothetical protein